MMMKPALDLTQFHDRQQHGDITIYSTWFGDNLRPCLALIPTYQRTGYKPAVILVDDAHLWSVDAGSPFYVQQQAPQIAKALGFEPTPATCARIANMIDDHLSDLLRIPPKPTNSVVVADAFLTNQDGKQRHFEVKDAR